MCKCCEGEKSFMHIVVERLLGNEDVFFIIMGNYVYIATEDGHINVKTRWRINYCPMCGKKLGGLK